MNTNESAIAHAATTISASATFSFFFDLASISYTHAKCYARYCEWKMIKCQMQAAQVFREALLYRAIFTSTKNPTNLEG
jgi:hypothetical protein